MNHKLSIFLPVRKGSKRILNKNTRTFSRFENGLLELKLEQLITLKDVAEIIVSSNDEQCLLVADKYRQNYPNIKINERPDELGKDSTDLVELIKYAGRIADSKHILWTHVTSPFIVAELYQDMIDKYFDHLCDKSDSLMSVTKIQNFMWDKEKNDLINRIGTQRWPRTQDLKTLYEVNSAAFIAPKRTYIDGDRVGEHPYLFELDDMVSHDIDWEFDFKLAELLYERVNMDKF